MDEDQKAAENKDSITKKRVDGFHVGTPPTNHTNNQDPLLRGKPQTGPPTQASTLPNTNVKAQQISQLPCTNVLLQQPPPCVASASQNPTQPSASTMSLAQFIQQYYYLTKNKRRSRAIPIIDPNTGKDKLNEMYEQEQDDSHPPSGESSARQTPQPPLPNPNKEVQAAFAKQVAQAIGKDEVSAVEELEQPPVLDHMGHTMYQPPPQAVHQRYDTIVQSSKSQYCSGYISRYAEHQTENKANAKTGAKIINGNPESKLNLPYRDDQWSPFNRDGKKVYDRDFLLALRNDPKSNKKPDNLPAAILANDDRGRAGGRSTDKSSPQRYQQPKHSNQKGKRNVPMEDTKLQETEKALGVVNIAEEKMRKESLKGPIKTKNEDVKLRECENPWRPARFIVYTNLTEDEIKTEKLYKKVRGVLNKLAPQNFYTLLDQVLNLGIDNTERLQGVTNLVFEKAVDEPKYSVAYALLCRELALMQVPAINSKKKEFVNFRKLLVTRCQLEFEKNSDEKERNRKIKQIGDCSDAEKKKHMKLNLEEYDRRLRMKSVGNIRFIGELFKQQMLTVNIMLRCLNNLLDTKDEQSLECLCVLFKTVGKKLSKKVDFGSIFSSMKDIADKKHENIGNKVRFMLQDVIDLRASRWVHRRLDSNPNAIDQIQKEVEHEHLTIQAAESVFKSPRRDERHGFRQQETLSKNIKDYLNGSCNLQECEQYIKASIPLSALPRLVYIGYISVLERSKAARLRIGFLFTWLIKSGTLSVQTYCAGLTNVLEKANELIFDIPSVWYNVAELICKLAAAIFKNANVGERVKENQFIRTLATACFEGSIVNSKLKADILQGKYNLFHHFIDNKYANELQCLYALQALINKLEHPQGLLLGICDKLYEENVFSRESFIAWEASKDPTEQEGKSVALKQLTSFFTQLKEADEDSSSSEDF